MRLPEVRAEMLAVAAELRMVGLLAGPGQLAARLERWADELKRKPRATNARPTSRSMTPQVAQEIRALAAKHPGMTQHDIGRLTGTNQGRVSEVLAGKRK